MGRSLSSISFHLGLDRSTVSRWRNSNPLFIAELHRRQREAWESAANRLRGLLLQSIQIIDQQLHGRYIDHRRAAAFRLLPILAPRALVQPIGPTDPQGVVDDMLRTQRQFSGQDPAAPITEDERNALLDSLTAEPDPTAAIFSAPSSPSPGTPGEGRGEGLTRPPGTRITSDEAEQPLTKAEETVSSDGSTSLATSASARQSGPEVRQ